MSLDEHTPEGMADMMSMLQKVLGIGAAQIEDVGKASLVCIVLPAANIIAPCDLTGDPVNAMRRLGFMWRAMEPKADKPLGIMLFWSADALGLEGSECYLVREPYRDHSRLGIIHIPYADEELRKSVKETIELLPEALRELAPKGLFLFAGGDARTIPEGENDELRWAFKAVIDAFWYGLEQAEEEDKRENVEGEHEW